MLIYYIAVGVLGLVLGSFAGATVWRLRAWQLVHDKAAGETVDASELKRLKPLAQTTLAKDRSRCLHCGHELAWYDLVPLLSWASTGGKCRYCQAPIGWFEPAIELGTAGLFVAFFYYFSHSFAPAAWPLLFVWAALLVLLVILFVYDAKWFLLPDVAMWPFIVLSGVVAVCSVLSATNIGEAAISTVFSVLLLGGLYFTLWFVSKGAWVGFGDVKLGLGLGLLLADWKLAFLTLFLANFIGTLLVLPGLVTRKLSRKAHIPFGPLLIAGFLIALFFGSTLFAAATGADSIPLMLY